MSLSRRLVQRLADALAPASQARARGEHGAGVRCG
jgi:hypothetical protein